ncbi:MAG: hypothetical protein KA112_04950 [Alphaproteobacteria bacterium]|nr:hypothetical protein [Alphaproteobacteria bacterium]MBP7729937.1 hypothetical protein [Alphaproteobacteria bacterium]
MKIRINYLIAVVSSFFYLISLTEAHKFIDVDDFRFPNDQNAGINSNSGIRIAVFDTDQQKYNKISYYKTLGRESPRELDFQEEGITVFSDGTVILLKNFKKETIIRSVNNIFYKREGKTDFPEQWENQFWTWFNAVDEKQQEKKVLHNGIQVKQARDVVGILSTEKYHKYKTDFEADYYDRKAHAEKWTFSQLSKFKHKHSKGGELGYLGELSVEMTMISFGYFNKLPSQNASNQGIDGVYTTAIEEGEMILTESKGQGSGIKQNSPKVVLNKALKESDLYKEIESMGKDTGRHNHPIFSETAEIIKKFINECSGRKNVFNLGHVLRVDGYCQYYGKEFDTFVYEKAKTNGLSVDSPLAQKAEATGAFLTKLCSDPKEEVEVLLKASNTPREDVLKCIFNEMGIEEIKQQEAFKVLGLKWEALEVEELRDLKGRSSPLAPTTPLYSKRKSKIIIKEEPPVIEEPEELLNDQIIQNRSKDKAGRVKSIVVTEEELQPSRTLPKIILAESPENIGKLLNILTGHITHDQIITLFNLDTGETSKKSSLRTYVGKMKKSETSPTTLRSLRTKIWESSKELSLREVKEKTTLQDVNLEVMVKSSPIKSVGLRAKKWTVTDLISENISLLQFLFLLGYFDAPK